MKKLAISLMLCTAALTAQAQMPTRMHVAQKNGNVVTYQIANIDSIWFSAEEPAPNPKQVYAISIGRDFSSNDVLRVMADGRQVAEICLEYINTVGQRLVMVYPMTEDGRADLSQGLCADNGGTIVWDTDEDTCRYEPGTSEPLTTVYLRDGLLTAAPQTGAVATTVEADVIIDKRGDEENEYRTVKIGTQYWMAQNLNATKYLNGQTIPFITSVNTSQWRNDTKGAYHVFADDEEFRMAYGPLYNGYAVENEAGLAPAGWDLPELNDFQRLKTYLGTQSGLKMKSDATAAWNISEGNEPNNLSGFSALAAGYYMVSGDGDYGFGTDAWFWTITEYDDPLVGTGLNTVRLNYATKNLTIYAESAHGRATYGHSVRCIKN